MATVQTIASAVQDVSGNSSTASSGPAKDLESGTYKVTNTNWYQSFPYGFSIWDINTKSGKAPYTIYLPIAPNNLTITTSFATNIITTLYGIVEEHSEVRYYDITIQGTTGFSPRFVDPTGPTATIGSNPKKNSGTLSPGRNSLMADGISLGGFLPEIMDTIKAAANLLSSNITGFNENETGIDADKSGYVAFHNLYRSFLKYKNDAAQVQLSGQTFSGTTTINQATGITPQVRYHHPIQFLNYKDGIKYDCVPLSFTMVRSADNPMMYNYVIKLKGFNLQNVNAKVPGLDNRAALGLGGLDGTNLFTKLTSVTQNAATLVSGLL